MKIQIYLSTAILAAFTIIASSCSDVLDLQPQDKLPVEAVFSSPAGVKLYMANLYYQLPTEDFLFFNAGFNQNQGGPNNGGQTRAQSTDEAVHSEAGGLNNGPNGDGQNMNNYWISGYSLVRDVNLLIDAIPTLNIPTEERDRLSGEASFVRAFAYFGIAIRYGGLPLIKESQEYLGDAESLKVQRSSEKETYDYILSELDVAITKLPESWNGERRATKWVALALKSRVALHAASLAKFWNKAPLTGDAVDLGYVGMSANDANGYYNQCIEASAEIMNSGVFSLYQPTPATPAEAAENYRRMFQDPNVALNEAIFIKGHTIPGDRRGHNYDIWFTPAQLANGWPHPGRMNPTLDLVDMYEDYTVPGQSAPIVTTTDGDIDNYNGFDANKTYLRFDNPSDPFLNKDARLHATVVLPGSSMKGTEIVIQAGYILPDGSPRIRTGGSVEINGKTYYNYGGPTPNDYSGFDGFGGNNTKTGFSFRKFLRESPVAPGWNQSTSDWIEFRYAEILLNYAEAVTESGLGDETEAAQAINDIRRRAGHTVAIPLTISNVMRERTVELAFENKRWWDLIRRRERHEVFEAQISHALLPILDLRINPVQYIFVRANVHNMNPRTFLIRDYYLSIPGVGASGVIQNPTG
ncbi:RagB/SusD family nutrient uptake outer membrane protein [Lunatibacter salilacus]|uniref:RagB/SusD family nutrient uptake outer membrane protein n=1 Tax=Lunatibacter salilacus TaxID=2483804 RepID=UPI00131DD6A8|nr:RagB/SusD family nutrient uptake outer membrane protein [Lunatibacter salilacus]